METEENNNLNNINYNKNDDINSNSNNNINNNSSNKTTNKTNSVNQPNSTENNAKETLKQSYSKKQEIFRIIKFVLFSISAGIVQIVSFTILSELIIKDSGNEYGVSYFISLLLSVIWNFTFNRKFTFKTAKNVYVAMGLILAYYGVFTPLSIWWGVALTNAHWNNYIVLFLTMVINMATEFLWSRFVVYRNSINTNQKENTGSSNIKK